MKLTQNEHSKVKIHLWPKKDSIYDYNAISNQQRINFLYNLGFDVSENRKYGYKYIQIQNDEIINYTWYQCISPTLKTIVKNHYSSQLSEKLYKNKYSNIFYKLSHVQGLSTHSHSNIIIFDIDAHPKKYTRKELLYQKRLANYTLHCLLKELNYHEPLYAETSIRGGFHIYYKFDNKHHPDTIKQWVEDFNTKYGTNLETNHYNKVFQLPDSVSYKPIYFTKLNEKNLEYKEYNSTNEYITHVTHYKNNIKEYLPNIIIHDKQICMYSNYSKPIQKNNKSYNLYYGKGERYNCWFIKGYGYRYYELSNGDYVKFSELVHHYNTGSEDMSIQPDKEINNLWKYISNKKACKIDQNNTQFTLNPEYYIDNTKYINKHLTEKDQKIIEKISIEICKKEFSHFKYKKNKKNVEYQILKTLQSLIIGRIIYEHEYEFQRKIGNKVLLTNKKRDEYEKGIQFFHTSIEKKLKKHFNFKMNHRNVFNAIMNNLYFLTIYKKHCYINTSNGLKSSRLYKIKQLDNDFYNNISKLLEITLYKLNIYNNNYIKYNIYNIYNNIKLINNKSIICEYFKEKLSNFDKDYYRNYVFLE